MPCVSALPNGGGSRAGNPFLGGSSGFSALLMVGYGVMPGRYEYPRDSAPWSGMPLVNAAPPPPPPPHALPRGRQYQDYPPGYDEPVGEARAQGLRRLSRLTWRATQLSALAAAGFAAIFAHTTHAQTTSSTAPAKPSLKASTPAPSPTKTKKHHHHPKPSALPTSGTHTGSGATASSPTLAPPTTAPSPPPPSPTPTPTTASSGSGGGK